MLAGSVPLLLALAHAPAHAPAQTADTTNAADALAESRVHRTLAAMQAAVERADSGAYMALIDTADPVFAEEQRKWARDLRTRPVGSVTILPDGPPRAASDGSRIVPLSITWTLPGSDREYAVTYDAAFRPLGLPEGAWLYAGRVWDERHAGGVRIMTPPGNDHADDMADYLETRLGPILESVEEELQQTLSTEPTIKIYPDMAALQASIALSYTDSLGGWNEPGESVKILTRPGLAGPRLDTVVAHELGHAVSFEYGPSIITAPWWVLEGIAELAADPFRARPPTNAPAERLAADNALVPFASLADFRGEAMNHARQVYVQGRSLLVYITDRYGQSTRTRWLRAMAQGRTLDEATRAVLGIDFTSLDAEWRATLTARDTPTDEADD